MNFKEEGQQASPAVWSASPLDTLMSSSLKAAESKMRFEAHTKASDRLSAISKRIQSLPIPFNYLGVPAAIIALKKSMDESYRANACAQAISRLNETQRMSMASHVVGSNYVLPSCPGNEYLLKLRQKHPKDMILVAQIMINDIGDEVLNKFPSAMGVLLDIQQDWMHCKLLHRPPVSDEDIAMITESSAYLGKAFSDLTTFINHNIHPEDIQALDAGWVRIKDDANVIMNCVVPREEFHWDDIVDRLQQWARGELDHAFMDVMQEKTRSAAMKM